MIFLCVLGIVFSILLTYMGKDYGEWFLIILGIISIIGFASVIIKQFI
jgi:hypothetical protein